MSNPIITHSQSLTNPEGCTPIKLFDVLATIKRDDRYGIQKIRNEDDKDKQNEMKRNLPLVLFSGNFTKRSKNNLEEASGLVCLDFDCESEREREDIRLILDNDPYILSYFTSTRGMGWKALIQIPKVKNDEEYKKYWHAINDRYPGVDEACKDISRACFYTYDPDLVYNKNAKVFTAEKDLNLNKAKQKIEDCKTTDYSLLNKALNVIRGARQGERHNKILLASRLAGGWVASGRVDQQEAERLLLQEANRKNPDEPHINKKTVGDGVADGIKEPIDKQEEEQLTAIDQLNKKFDRLIWTIDDVSDELDKMYENGKPEGYKTGYSEIDELYNMHLGYTTYLYGTPFSGKSQLWFDFLKNYSYRYGMKHAIFSPETGNASDIARKLIELVAGKDFYDEYDNRMNKDELLKAKKFVDEHFLIIDPGIESMTIEEVMSSCQLIERVHNIKLHTLTIDPWNELIHKMDKFSGRQDMYLEKKLAKVRKIAAYNDWHITIITHVSTQNMTKKYEGGTGYYPPATFYDIAGGQAWSRRGFMMSSIWRPPAALSEKESNAHEPNDVLWIQQKYKPEWSGQRGEVTLKYDTKKHRYYTGTGALKSYANLGEEQENQPPKHYVEAPF